MTFAAIVARAGGIGGLGIPFENGELSLTALNDEPAHGVAAFETTDVTAEFLKC